MVSKIYNNFDIFIVYIKSVFLFFLRFYLFFLQRRKGRERNIYVGLPLVHPLRGPGLCNPACALTRNWTGNTLVCRLALNPLSHTSQGLKVYFYCDHEFCLLDVLISSALTLYSFTFISSGFRSLLFFASKMRRTKLWMFFIVIYSSPLPILQNSYITTFC